MYVFFNLKDLINMSLTTFSIKKLTYDSKLPQFQIIRVASEDEKHLLLDCQIYDNIMKIYADR